MRSEQSRKLSDKEPSDAVESAITEPAAAQPAEVVPAVESPVSEPAPPPQVSAEALSSIVKVSSFFNSEKLGACYAVILL